MNIEEKKLIISSKEPSKECGQNHITSTGTVPVVVKSEETDEGCRLEQIKSEHNYHKDKCIRDETVQQELRIKKENAECCSTEDDEVLTMKCEVFDEPLIQEKTEEKEFRIKKENAEDFSIVEGSTEDEQELTMKCEVFDEPLIPEETKEKELRIKKEEIEEKEHRIDKENTEDEEEVLTMKCEVFDEPLIPYVLRYLCPYDIGPALDQMRLMDGTAALSPSARRELISRKRVAHIERMFLPDTPPRKLQTKRTSPEGFPCIMVASPVDLCVEFNPLESAQVVTSTSSVLRSSEPLPVEPARTEASTSGAPNDSGVTDTKFDSTIVEWLTEICDSDNDLDTDNCPLPTIQERNATTEPACDSDMTQFEVEVLQKEDDANDRALRSIVPDDSYTFTWSNDRRTFLGRRETFTGTPGPTFELTDQTRPIDIFDKTFDVDFIDLLCRETNRNAEQTIALLREQNKLAPHSRFNRWSPTDRDEMLSFLSIIILQGLYPLPEEEAYFTFNGFGTMPYFAKIMSYNRFLLIKTFLHFVDNGSLQDRTRRCKIRPVIDYFNAKFSSLYMPSQEIAIDECLLKWHGRLNFAQKIKSKAAQVGIKTYELCESASGYLWKLFVYAGKDKPTSTTKRIDGQNIETINRPDEDETIGRFDDDQTSDRVMTGESGDRPTNATAMIVYDLIAPLLHRGHTVIMDNFYNSPLLLRTLKKQKTDCFGTLRLNREFVPDSVKTLTKTDLRQGEVVATYCSDLSILVWRNANIVSLISTYHDLQIGIQDKYNKLTYKPNIVLDYNKSMGGVDRKDQILSAQPLERMRNRVWYKKLFRRLYNAAIFNCFVIFSSFHRKILHRQFRIELAEDLLKRHRQIDLTTEYRRLNIRSNTNGQVTTTLVRRNARHKTQARPIVEDNHFPIRTGSKNTCCWMCPKKTRTIWKCEECDINLCIEGCFRAYHKS